MSGAGLSTNPPSFSEQADEPHLQPLQASPAHVGVCRCADLSPSRRTRRSPTTRISARRDQHRYRRCRAPGLRRPGVVLLRLGAPAKGIASITTCGSTTARPTTSRTTANRDKFKAAPAKLRPQFRRLLRHGRGAGQEAPMDERPPGRRRQLKPERHRDVQRWLDGRCWQYRDGGQELAGPRQGAEGPRSAVKARPTAGGLLWAPHAVARSGPLSPGFS